MYPLLPTLNAGQKDDSTIGRKSSLNFSSLDTPHLRVLLLQLVMKIVAIVLYSFTDEKFIACVIVVSVSGRRTKTTTKWSRVQFRKDSAYFCHLVWLCNLMYQFTYSGMDLTLEFNWFSDGDLVSLL